MLFPLNSPCMFFKTKWKVFCFVFLNFKKLVPHRMIYLPIENVHDPLFFHNHTLLHNEHHLATLQTLFHAIFWNIQFIFRLFESKLIFDLPVCHWPSCHNNWLHRDGSSGLHRLLCHWPIRLGKYHRQRGSASLSHLLHHLSILPKTSINQKKRKKKHKRKNE